MTKKVLGNDPFAPAGTDAKTPDDASDVASKAPSARTSVAPKNSKRPSRAAPKPSKRPSRAGKSTVELEQNPALRAPKIPVEALTTEDAGSEARVPAAAHEAELLDSNARPMGVPSLAPLDEDSMGGEGSVTPMSSFPDELPEAKVDDGPSLPVDEQIKRLELQLDALLKKKDDPREGSAELKSAEQRRDEQRMDDVGELATSEYFAKQWGRVAMRDRAEEVDEFGLDHEFQKRAQPFVDALYSRWWRVETIGITEVPSTGSVILCANHAGAVPYDGLMLAEALRREHPAKRELRWLADDFVFHFPFMGVALNRLGAVRACQENAERLLRHDRVVGVFPEGVKGIAKSMGQRYELQRFGRGGHVKLALRTRTPIVPVAIVGSEETHPLLPTGLLAKLLNVSFLPVTPTFPWLGPLGLIPLPAKWTISFLEPIDVAHYGADAAEDDVLVGRLNEKIRTMIQDELSLRTRQRKSIFRG
jgi:1-acyl-sn-glycerol-3-phosphate acyltransferase